MTLPIAVTYHAIRRYLERVMGVDFAMLDRLGLGDREAVEIVCEATETPADYIVQRIRSDVGPRLAAVSRLRGSRRVIRGERCKYIINDGRVVVSAMPSEWKVA